MKPEIVLSRRYTMTEPEGNVAAGVSEQRRKGLLAHACGYSQSRAFVEFCGPQPVEIP